MKKRIFYLFLLISILNFTSVPQFLGIEPMIHNYHYAGMTGTELIEIPEKGKTINFKLPGLKRKFEMQIWKIWKWKEYLTHERWQLEYEE